MCTNILGVSLLMMNVNMKQYETICGNDRVCQTRCMSGYPYSCNEVCWLEYVCREEYICYNK